MLFIAGCAEDTGGNNSSKVNNMTNVEKISDIVDEDGVYRYKDNEAKVLCYIVEDGGSTSISCVDVGN